MALLLTSFQKTHEDSGTILLQQVVGDPCSKGAARRWPWVLVLGSHISPAALWSAEKMEQVPTKTLSVVQLLKISWR